MCADPHPRTRAVARYRCARGQALVEALAAAIVLVPFALLIVWLGKIQTIQQASVAASRMLAFECAARPADCESGATRPTLVDELRRRAFSRTDVQPLTEDRLADDPPSAERNPLWVDRSNRPLIERFSDIGARIDRQSFDAGLSLATSQGGGGVADAAGLLAEHAGPGRFGLGLREGLVVARVQAGVSAGTSATGFLGQLDSIALRMRASTAILTDAWNASGPYGGAQDSVETRVAQGASVLGVWEASVDARHALTRGFIGLMGAIGLEPSAGKFRYHDVDVDLVPPDRVGGASSDTDEDIRPRRGAP